MLIHPVTRSDVAMLDHIRAIYVDAIPASERKPNSWLTEIVERADYSIFAGIVEADVAGFGILFLPVNEPMALLEYFAVDAMHRGRGIGSELISQIIARAEQRCVLAEVESGQEEANVRRQEFYRRLGFLRVAGLNYLLPLDSYPPPMDMLLLKPPGPLPRQVFVRWLEVIYEDVYGRSIEDPRLAGMIAQISDPVRFE